MTDPIEVAQIVMDAAAEEKDEELASLLRSTAAIHLAMHTQPHEPESKETK